MKIDIVVTNDRGDALEAAVQIASAAHQAWSREPAANWQIGLMLASIKAYLSKQWLEYLKTGGVK